MDNFNKKEGIMYSFAAGAFGTALIIVGLTYFSKNLKSARVVRAFMLIWAGITFFIMHFSR